MSYFRQLGAFQFMRPVWGATYSVTLSSTYFGFQFMRPVWGATGDVRHDAALPHISIYAPRMGRYASTSVQGQAHIHFNLCAPYGALRFHFVKHTTIIIFQFMRPVWGATFLKSISPPLSYKFQFMRPVWGATATIAVIDIPQV